MKKLFTILFVIVSVALISSCKDEKDPAPHPKAGEKMGDGIIFDVKDGYIYIVSESNLTGKNMKGKTGDIEVWMNFARDTLREFDTTYNLPDSTTFLIDTNVILGYMNTSYDNGFENTQKIIDHPKHEFSAAKWCQKYAAKEDKSDTGEWYLPSREEMKKLYYARDRVNAVATQKMENCYWTSSEGSKSDPKSEFRNTRSAFYRCFNGVESTYSKNRDYLLVRAVKKVRE